MAKSPKVAAIPSDSIAPPTQRAYTLRLRGADSNDSSWRDALWATHEAINNGAKAFGEWLLTLRGGLEHTLADAPIKDKKATRPPNIQERRDRRVLLALSWLTVEDERGASKEPGMIVAYGDDCKVAKDSQDGRDRKLIEALCGILKNRGVQPAEINGPGGWVADCEASLKARIRDDAVWVNRSAAFDALAKAWTGLTRENAGVILEEFFGSRVEWITLPARAETEDGDEGAAAPAGGGAGDGEEFRTIARSFLSTNLGTGPKSDKAEISESLKRGAHALAKLRPGIAGAEVFKYLCEEFSLSSEDTDDAREAAIVDYVGWKGRPSKGRLALTTAAAKKRLEQEDIDTLCQKFREEAEVKSEGATKSVPPWIGDLTVALEGALGFGYVVERNLIGEFGVMLDHAARRVSIACSWIKLAEIERRQFEADADKLVQVRREHPSAVAFLEQLGNRRGGESGTAGGVAVLIRKRAIMGWKEIVAAWARPACKTAKDRVDAAHVLQGELDKFGDSKLFEELASDEAKVVWRNEGGSADPSILERYVAGTVALANQQRFKVPAYRHPDSLRHPVFGDFGVSRWDIDFAIHERIRAAASGKRVQKADAAWHADPRNMRMGLWTGQRVEKVSLRWSSKRLAQDLAIRESGESDPRAVTRADRLGRAAAGENQPVFVSSVFDEDNWNGRLQAPRDELNRIARLIEKGNPAQARKLRDRISWLVSFSPKLTPSGPFIDYARQNGIEPNRKSGEYWPNTAINKERNGHAKLIYARLPGLRVLSVDLGHRYAAACAIWESMSSEQIKRAASGGKILRGGIGADHLFAHIETPVKGGKPRTTVYRRIGEDTLPDGSSHPSSWAKLERQFLIKLQGEEAPSRMSSDDERAMVGRWEQALGLKLLPKDSPKQSKNVADLMARAVRLLMLAARRHHDCARIAHNLMAKHRTRPGGVPQPLDDTGRVELLIETLALWHERFAGDRWTDNWAANLWKANGLPDLGLPARSSDDEGGGCFGGPGRKAAIEEYHAKLRPHAERLSKTDLSDLSKSWANRWKQDDQIWEHRKHKSGLLRELRQWITPRGLRITDKDNPAEQARKADAALQARHVGGVSMQRINTLTGLYRLLKSYKNRPDPENLRKGVAEKGDDSLRNFHQRLLDVRDRLREQRVKQLTSRITEAALGIGRIKSKHIVAGAARPTLRIDDPCHAVVIESLTNYRPDELQTRRENRQLMEWSSAKVQKYLAESCQLHGLHLREVQPNHTSRQCSRTGAPGMRCVEVSAHDLLTKMWWKKDVAKAKANIEKAKKDGRDGARSDHLFADAGKWALGIPERDRADRKVEGATKPFYGQRIILPRKGGDLFISASASPNDKGRVPALQADLNAAANIGLRALLDPDWPGKWWWVPCTGGTYTPAPDKTKGANVFKTLPVLPHAQTAVQLAELESKPAKRAKANARSSSARETRPIENRWRHVSSSLPQVGEWKSTGQYWAEVEAQVCASLSRQLTTNSAED
jgi:IS605 OrfB family transposase